MSEGPRISLPLNCEGVRHQLFDDVTKTAEALVETPGIGGKVTRINANFSRNKEDPWGVIYGLDFLVYLEIEKDQHWVKRYFGASGSVGISSCTVPGAKPSAINYMDSHTHRGRNLTGDGEFQLQELQRGLRDLVSFLISIKKDEIDALAHRNDISLALLQAKERDLEALLLET